jgi:activator of HSP90 ATPase
MTGGAASITAEVGDEFDAWDGYIHGKNLELEPGRHIFQSWRTVEFDESDPDSRLEISLQAEGLGTRLILKHTNLPSHGDQYQQGWVDNYFEPMKSYFERLNR